MGFSTAHYRIYWSGYLLESPLTYSLITETYCSKRGISIFIKGIMSKVNDN